jgi:hypothetical protein
MSSKTSTVPDELRRIAGPGNDEVERFVVEVVACRVRPLAISAY